MGIILVFAIPPFQAPDEPAHFFRAYQISEGHFVADRYGGVLPNSLQACFAQFDDIRFNPRTKVHFKALHAAFLIPLHSEARTYFRFPNTAIYSPVPYIGSAAAIWVGRLLGFGPLALMYLGRLGNLSIYVVLGRLAMRQLPALKVPAMVVFASPVPLFLASTLSADALTTVFVFLATAQIADAAMGRLITRFSGICLGASLIAVQFCKWAYAPALIFLWAIPRSSWGGRSHRRVGICLISGLCLLALCGWMYLSDARHDQMHDSNPPAQMTWIIHQPVQFVSLMALTMVHKAVPLGYTSMGAMGWQDALIPRWFVDLHFAVILLLSCNEPNSSRITVRMRFLSGIAVFTSLIFLLTLEYLGWNEPGSNTIQGLQGRYLIPLFLMSLFVICCDRVPLIGERFAKGWILVCGGVCLAVVLDRYY